MKSDAVQALPVDLALHQAEGDANLSPCRADWQANERDAKADVLLDEPGDHKSRVSDSGRKGNMG
jgi:hypothetical protein